MSNPEENKDLVGESANDDQVAESQPEASQPEASQPEANEPEVGETEPGPTQAGHDELNLGQERVLEFVSFVVVNLVDHPEDVTVDIVRRQGRDVYQVRVNSEDLGKVIGKGGQTARALRVMLTALSSRTDQRVGLEIVE